MHGSRSITDRARSRRRSQGARAGATRRGPRAAYEERARQTARAFASCSHAEAEECAQLTTTEMGKPIAQARNEIRAVLERIDWNVEHVGEVIAPRTVHDGDGSKSASHPSRSVSSRTSARGTTRTSSR